MPLEVSSNMKMFADDTKLYKPLTNPSERGAGLQGDLDALARWSSRWLLPFNAGKCKVMHMGSRNPAHEYRLNGTPIAVVDEERDLGIIIDSELKFHTQTAAAVSKASQLLAVIKRSFAHIDETTLPLLYKALVRPFLEFGNAVWGPFSKGDQKRLEKVQRRATRMVESIKHLPYPERLERLRLPSLFYRRRRGDMLTVYQLFHGGIDVPATTFFTKNETELTRGHGWKLLKPRAVTLARRSSFSVRIINDWNALPAEVVSAETLSTFKARLDHHWTHLMYVMPQPYES